MNKTKRYGQNFLVDRNIALAEVKYADITKDDVVLEIGPGKGILTCLLAERAKRVIAIEIDKDLIKNLESNLPDNVILIKDDVLNVNFKDLPCFNKIVSNLPFKISSPVTFKILDYDFDVAYLIYQKEFADRMVAKPNSKNYSRLSVGVYYKAFCEIIRYVPKTCFNPQPKVDSCIVKLLPKKSPPFNLENEEFFFDLTKKLFNHRRKKVKYTIKNEFSINDNCIPFLDERVENLSPEDIGDLSNIIYKKIFS